MATAINTSSQYQRVIKRDRIRLLIFVAVVIFFPVWFAEIVIFNFWIGDRLTWLFWCVSIGIAAILALLVFYVFIYFRAQQNLQVLAKVIFAFDATDFDQIVNNLSQTRSIEEEASILANLLIQLKKNFSHFKQNLLHKTQETARIKDELIIARNLQQHMLPTEFINVTKNFPNISVYANLIPATEVSGDFYDVFALDDDKLLLTIGDVCGKGIAACVLMSRLLTIIRTSALAMQHSKSSESTMLLDLLARLNTGLYQVGYEHCMFATMILAIFDMRTNKLIYCNAGHNPLCVISTENKSVKFIENSSKPVGIREQAVYQCKELQLAAGDYCLFYTDGIVETHDQAGALFDEHGMEKSLLGRVEFGSKAVVNGLLQDAGNFAPNIPQEDDMTALIIHHHMPKSGTMKSTAIQTTKPIKSSTITVKSGIEAIKTVQIEIKSFLLANRFKAAELGDLDVCIEEILANIIKYGYGPNKPGDIDVKIDLYTDEFCLQFIDQAMAFNPLQLLASHMATQAKRTSGERGLKLVASMADGLAYSRKDDHNILSVIKKYSSMRKGV